MSPLALSLRFLQAQPDGRLVALAREGHEPAFEALVRRYRKELLSYCRRLQPQSGGAEDALQQTLLQAWKALRDGAEVRDARPWLYRIAHNVTVNSFRTPVPIPHEVTETRGGHEVDQLVEQRLQARAALAGVASLPTLQRQVFMRTTLDGQSHEEAASALGLSSGAVRGLMYRARAAVRAGAAAVIPAPVLGWLLRRADSQTGGSPAVAEMLAGGSGAGLAAAIAKGGAVLTLAVAGASGVVLGHGGGPHPGPAGAVRAPLVFHNASDATGATLSGGSAAGASAPGSSARDVIGAAEAAQGGHESAATGRHDGSGPAEMTGSDGGSGGGSDEGSGGGRDGGSSGGTATGIVSTSSGSGSDGGGTGDSSGATGGSAGATSGSSDGGTSGSSAAGTSGGGSGTSTTSGSGGGTSDGSSGSSSGSSGSGQTTSHGSTADLSSGSDGGSSGASGDLISGTP